jgi:hypothetical protein
MEGIYFRYRNDEKDYLTIHIYKYEDKSMMDYNGYFFEKHTKAIKNESYDKIYNKFTNLNFKEIIDINDEYCGFSGSKLEISSSAISLKVWNLNYKTKERKLEYLHSLALELFSLCDVEPFTLWVENDGVFE